MVIFLAGMQDVPRQLLEAVEIDGGGFWAKLLHVTIPMMTPTIFYNVVMESSMDSRYLPSLML